MSKIDCGDDPKVPCYCDPITGCGHLSSWHMVFQRWTAKCLMPGCECKSMDVCNCCDGFGANDNGSFLVSIGIAKDDAIG